MSESVKNIVSKEELVRLRGEVRGAGGGGGPALDLPPGEDEPPDHVVSHIVYSCSDERQARCTPSSIAVSDNEFDTLLSWMQ